MFKMEINFIKGSEIWVVTRSLNDERIMGTVERGLVMSTSCHVSG